MNTIRLLLGSSVGRKYVMAASGGVLFLFLVGHLLGNLQCFAGPDALNRYAELLQRNRGLLWSARVVLLALLGLHLRTMTTLSVDNCQARPRGYAGRPAPVAAGLASRTMLLSGIAIACFVIYHLLHYTLRLQAVNLTGTDFAALEQALPDGTRRPDVFRMMVLGFSRPVVSAFYLLAVGLVCLHVSHGIRAAFQSLGLMDRRWRRVTERIGPLLAWVLFLGYASIPVAVLLGFGARPPH